MWGQTPKQTLARWKIQLLIFGLPNFSNASISATLDSFHFLITIDEVGSLHIFHLFKSHFPHSNVTPVTVKIYD